MDKPEKKITGQRVLSESMPLTPEGYRKRKSLIVCRALIYGALVIALKLSRCGEGMSDKMIEEAAEVPMEEIQKKPIKGPKKPIAPSQPKKPAAPSVPPVEPERPKTEEEAKFKTEVLNEKEMPVLVIFWSLQRDSIDYRYTISSTTKYLAEKMEKKVKIYTIDLSQPGGRYIAQTYGVFPAPCLMIFKNGVPAESKMWCWGPEGSVGASQKNDKKDSLKDSSSEIIGLTNKHIRQTREGVGKLRKESEPRQ